MGNTRRTTGRATRPSARISGSGAAQPAPEAVNPVRPERPNAAPRGFGGRGRGGTGRGSGPGRPPRVPRDRSPNEARGPVRPRSQVRVATPPEPEVDLRDVIQEVRGMRGEMNAVRGQIAQLRSLPGNGSIIDRPEEEDDVPYVDDGRGNSRRYSPGWGAAAFGPRPLRT